MSMDQHARDMVFDFTRFTRRKTMPDYFSGVLIGRNTLPYWSCKHKHESRIDAYHCVRVQYPCLRLPSYEGVDLGYSIR